MSARGLPDILSIVGRTIRLLLLTSALACGRGAVGEKGLVAHSSFFVVGGSHAGFTCDQCHAPSAAGFALSEQGVTCTGCHTDAATTPVHSGVSGYAWSNAACISCHKDGGAGLPANHDTADFPVTGTVHAGIGCSACHGATRALADITCVPCHAQAATATIHAKIPATKTGTRDGKTYTNYQWKSAACLTCHADGQVNAISSHPRFDHGLTGSGHAPFCLTCHVATAPPGGKAWSADFSQSTCLACHTTNNP